MFPPLAGGVVSDSWSAGGASSGTDGMPLNHNLLLVGTGIIILSV